MSITVFKNDSLINYFSDDAVATGQIQLTDPMQLLADPNLLRNALLTYSEK